MAPEPVALLDVNVLIALAWPQHLHHRRAHEWLGLLAGRRWATAPFTEAAFVRLSSTTAVVHTPVTALEAVQVLARIRQVDGHVFLADDTSLADSLIALDRLASPKQVTDMHLVNLAARHQARLVTFDHGIHSYLDAGDRRHVELIA